MKVPISWLREYVDFDLSIPELAHRLTLAGLEVEEVWFVGLPIPGEAIEGHTGSDRNLEFNVHGLAWAPEKIVVGAILEVMPHPNADKLVLCRLDDGEQEHVVLTGAPNLFPFNGLGTLDTPLKVAYAKEGAELYDGHKPGWERMTLERAEIRGVESYSMACSEKELGISEDHEVVILLDQEAPVGVPLVDYMGDAVLDITITPNIARTASILGVAREVAAITGTGLREPSYEVAWEGPSLRGRVKLDIPNPALNPRFVLGLIENVTIGPSPYSIQYRLRLAGMRPINNIVDATNYVMLELGQPLHAFDFDILVTRAGGGVPEIFTRLPEKDETLQTLDEIDRSLDDFTVLVADQAGALSLAGVMGGAESEVREQSRSILLEGASWNYVNIRRTVQAQNSPSEASYRFERGVHPAMAERGVRRGLDMMRQLTGGVVARDLVDEYPLPPKETLVEITPADVRRWLGIELDLDTMASLLNRLAFHVEKLPTSLKVRAPDHRLDIGEGAIGKADLMEEIARVYGYDNIPETQISDVIPPQYGNPALDKEEQIRDLLVNLGLQEIINYRLTTPEREMMSRSRQVGEVPYVRISNPISSDRTVMRTTLLPGMLEIAERNSRQTTRLGFFELGPVFQSTEADLPEEEMRLCVLLMGQRIIPSWQGPADETMDFFDLKGVLTRLLERLHISGNEFQDGEHPSFHPGKMSLVRSAGMELGHFGEIHPIVCERYNLLDAPVLAAELNLEMLMQAIPDALEIEPISAFPPVLEDIALIVDEELSAEKVKTAILEAGEPLVRGVHLFDLFRGNQIGDGKKSLAYSIVYQASDRTLTDEEVAKVRKKIVEQLANTFGAKLRD